MDPNDAVAFPLEMVSFKEMVMVAASLNAVQAQAGDWSGGSDNT